MAALGNIASLRLFSSSKSATTRSRRTTTVSSPRPRISCTVAWDPEGILGPPQTGHFARKDFQSKLEKDSDAREAYERQVREEIERRHAARQVINVSETQFCSVCMLQFVIGFPRLIFPTIFSPGSCSSGQHRTIS